MTIPEPTPVPTVPTAAPDDAPWVCWCGKRQHAFVEQRTMLGLTMLRCDDGHERQMPRMQPKSGEPKDGFTVVPEIIPPITVTRPRPEYVRPNRPALVRLMTSAPADQTSDRRRGRPTKQRCEQCGSGMYNQKEKRCRNCRADQQRTGKHDHYTFPNRCGCGRPLRKLRKGDEAGERARECYQCRLRSGG